MKINSNIGRGKSSKPRASKKVFFFSSTRYFSKAFNFPSSFRLNKLYLSPPEGHTSQKHFFFLLECRILFGSPQSYPKQKLRKNFFVKNDHERVVIDILFINITF